MSVPPQDSVPVAGQGHGPAAGQSPPEVAYVVAPPSPKGAVAWAMGFLAYLPIPILNTLVTGIVQLLVGRAQRKHGGLAARNGIKAANWGLTQLTWLVVLAVVVILAILTATPEGQPNAVMDVVLLIAAGGYFLVGGLLQLIYAIVGTVRASRGGVTELPVIPFLRMPPEESEATEPAAPVL